MKSLFVSSFFALIVVLLTVAAHAEQYVVPSNMPIGERMMLREMPVYSVSSGAATRVYAGEPVSVPIPYTMPDTVSYTATKPTETPITVPEPLRRVPLLPIQELPPVAETSAEIVRGQSAGSTLRESLDGVLSTPPPLPGGAVGAGTIESKLIDRVAGTDSELDLTGIAVPDIPSTTALPKQPSGTKSPDAASADPLGSGVLIVAMIITTLGLIYMAFIAYDYRQRWVHSLTVQNDRYILGGVFDMDTEGEYGTARLCPL